MTVLPEQRKPIDDGKESGHLSREALLKSARESYERKKSTLEMRISQLEAKKKEYDQSERFRQIGDVLLSGYVTENQAKKAFARAFDFYENKEILVEIDECATPAQNSAKYYEKYRKAKSGIEEIRTELARANTSRAQLAAWIAGIESEQNPLAIAKELRVGGAARAKEKPKYPFQNLEYRGWTIFIGRSGKENDDILRHYAKGFDLWLHARDYSGAYVFVRAQKNKSIPPEVLQAAARLALYYSKARKNCGGDLHTTFAKNLRRVKGGPVGLVIPYLEKNLYITFTEAQIREIFESSGTVEEDTRI